MRPKLKAEFERTGPPPKPPFEGFDPSIKFESYAQARSRLENVLWKVSGAIGSYMPVDDKGKTLAQKPEIQLMEAADYALSMDPYVFDYYLHRDGTVRVTSSWIDMKCVQKVDWPHRGAVQACKPRRWAYVKPDGSLNEGMMRQRMKEFDVPIPKLRTKRQEPELDWSDW